MSNVPLVRVLTFCAALAGLLACMAARAAGTPLDFDDARHLLVRTGFGPTLAEVQALVGRSRADAVDAILGGARSTPSLPPPGWTGTLPAPDERPRRGMTADERKALRAREREALIELRGWWLTEMRDTPSPLTERMTLFWHGHFATGVQKVRDPRLMYVQNALFRREALGNFARLLHAVARDPAMLIWLDGGRNRVGAPNENFAREVMELFTLGEGHYTQGDVTEAARAFTGFTVDRADERTLFRPRLHDDGAKTILGARAAFDADGAIDALLAQPQTATFIVTKLWREFVSPEPDRAEVRRIADAFRASHYEIKVALRALLLSDAFWDAKNRGTLVKSPVELVVGTLRTLEIDKADTRSIVASTTRMGETLFAPPNVRGWPGGDAWISSATLVARKAFVARATRVSMPASGADAPRASMAAANGVEATRVSMPSSAVAVGAWQHLLLPLPPVGQGVAEATAERDSVGVIRAAMLDPVYQLK